MKFFGRLTGAVMITVLVLAGTAVAVFQPPMNENLESLGQIVVEFGEGLDLGRLRQSDGLALTGQAGLDALARQFKVHRLEKLISFAEKPTDPGIRDISRFYIVHFPLDLDMRAVAAAYARDPHILSAELVVNHKVDFIPNDPLYYSLWAMTNMHASLAFDYCQGSSDVIIGIIDSGTDTTHPDLRSNLWINPYEDLDSNGIIDYTDWNGLDDGNNGRVDDFWGWNFWQNNNDVMDNMAQGGHGTHVAGCATAVTNNAVGIASLGYKAKVLTVRAGDGQYVYNPAWLNGLSYAVSQGAKIISMSFGNNFYSGYEQSILTNAWNQGAMLFAAAGNDNSSDPHFPSAYENVISVAATDANDHKTGFSNFGSQVDVCAPGINITSTWPYGGYSPQMGTSMACPIAAGLAALVMAARPTWTNAEVAQQIYETCVNIDALNPGFEGLLGHGRIDAGAAISGLFPNLAYESNSFEEVTGNGDDRIDPGETWNLLITVNNSSRSVAANDVTVGLTCNSENVTISQGTCNLGTIATQGSQNNNSSPFTFSVAAGVNPFETVFTLNMTEPTLLFPIILGIPQQIGLPKVLVVDDDGGMNFQIWYDTDLDTLGIIHDIWNVATQGEVSYETLSTYEKVIWHTSNTDDPLTLTEQAAIQGYLTNHGRLFLVGEDIDEQLDSTEFYPNVLHAASLASAGSPMLAGVAGDPISGGTSLILAGAGGAGNSQSASGINPADDAVMIYTYSNGLGAGLRWSGAEGALVYLAFNFEAASPLPTYSLRRVVLQNAFTWFDSLVTGVEPQAEQVMPTEFVLDQNYPNPFNPGTEIAFALPQPARVKLAVYDLSGRLVATLVNGDMPAGHHKAVFEAPDLPSGVYLYRLEAGTTHLARKMVLLK